MQKETLSKTEITVLQYLINSEEMKAQGLYIIYYPISGKSFIRNNKEFLAALELLLSLDFIGIDSTGNYPIYWLTKIGYEAAKTHNIFINQNNIQTL